MSIILYYSPMSSATRVQWALEELGLHYSTVKVDLSKGEQRHPEFLAINPNGKIPALLIDGVPMFESLAMIQFLGETFGVNRNLWPAQGTPERLAAYSWSVWSQVTFGSHIGCVVSNTSERTPTERRNAAAADFARSELQGDLKVLEGRLRGRDHLLGDHFTLVDLAAASNAAFISMMKVTDLDAFPRTAAWFERCSKRPALAVALAG